MLLESNPHKARAIGRRSLGRYLSLTNYPNNLLSLGYGEDELNNGGSDRVVDDLVGWGGEADLRAHLQAHWDAGADHVCISSISPDPKNALPDERILNCCGLPKLASGALKSAKQEALFKNARKNFPAYPS